MYLSSPSIHHSFILNLLQKAANNKKTILLPEGEELRMIKAACYCEQERIAHCVLLGDEQKIHDQATMQAINIPASLEIQSLSQVDSILIQQLVTLRKHKGMSVKLAKEALYHPINLAMMKLYNGQVDGVVSGSVMTTAEVLRSALQIIRTKNQQQLSSLFFMCLPRKALVYADCAINRNPSALELSNIAVQTALSVQKFGIVPKVALLSYSTHNSGQGDQVDKIKEACLLIKEKSPDLLIDGPLQYDAAVIPEIAKKKAPKSVVAGQANVLIFPDLNAANITYKAVQCSTGCFCVGPVLQGLNRAVNDLSRGASIEDIIATIAITALQSEFLRQEESVRLRDEELIF